MKKLVILALDKGSIAFLVLIIVAGFVSGYTTHDFSTGVVGAIFAFIFAVPFFGFLFLMLEMNENLTAIRKALESQMGR